MKVTFIYLAKIAINRRIFRAAPLTYSLLAAYTPEDIEVEIIDEGFETIDYDMETDLVAMTFVVPLATRAYEVASQFRRRGKTVVCGGPHATLMPEEAGAHFDAVVVGDGDRSWPLLLSDFRHGQLKKYYRSPNPVDLSRVPTPRSDLLNAKYYGILNSVQATRGCPFRCRFCSTRTIYPKYTRQPISRIVRQVEQMEGNPIQRRVIQFWDDNLAGDPDWAKRLFREMTPLNKIWFGQMTLSATRDAELIRLAAKSGCRCIFLGIESFNSSSLSGSNKGHNQVRSYRQGIQRLHDHGISVYAGIMFGFDDDRSDIFEKTLEKIVELGIDMVATRIVTPYPNTEFFRSLMREHRILHTDWSRYNGSHAVFRPRHMTPSELERGFKWFDREIHSIWAIAKRFWKSKTFPLGVLPVNLSKNRAIQEDSKKQALSLAKPVRPALVKHG